MIAYALIDFTKFAIIADDSDGMLCTFVTKEEAVAKLAQLVLPEGVVVATIDIDLHTARSVVTDEAM